MSSSSTGVANPNVQAKVGIAVSPAQALSEKGNNSKCIESKSMTSSDVLPLILVCLYVKFNVSTCKTF